MISNVYSDNHLEALNLVMVACRFEPELDQIGFRYVVEQVRGRYTSVKTTGEI